MSETIIASGPTGENYGALHAAKAAAPSATDVRRQMTGSEQFDAAVKASNARAAELQAASRWSYESARCAAELWKVLPGNAADTLNALVKNGPLWDGNVPSKTGRDLLVDLHLATRGIVVKGEMGYQAATPMGLEVWRAGHPVKAT